MTRTLALTGILMMAAVLVVPSAYARGRGHGGGGGGGGGGGWDGEGRGDRDFSCRGVDRLDLSEEQAEMIEALRDAYQNQAEPMRDALELQRDELRTLWDADVLDSEAIRAQMDTMEPNRQALREMRVEFKLDVYEVLSPEQQDELQEFRSERKGKRSERRELRKERRGSRGAGEGYGDGRGRSGRGGWDD
jgi:Spy/CpxP family protein refolding chaperone